jgi:heterodisulfide reductase subunit A-like polyferredoxin
MKGPTAIVVGKYSHAIVNQTKTDNSPFELGAGAGGVAIAARLAKEGFTVTVVEKNGFIGGRCSLIQEDGYVRSLSHFLC